MLGVPKHNRHNRPEEPCLQRGWTLPQIPNYLLIYFYSAGLCELPAPPKLQNAEIKRISHRQTGQVSSKLTGMPLSGETGKSRHIPPGRNVSVLKLLRQLQGGPTEVTDHLACICHFTQQGKCCRGIIGAMSVSYAAHCLTERKKTWHSETLVYLVLVQRAIRKGSWRWWGNNKCLCALQRKDLWTVCPTTPALSVSWLVTDQNEIWWFRFIIDDWVIK